MSVIHLHKTVAPEISGDFLDAVISGLSQPQKSIPSRFFYDKRGSELFEKITALHEYYPTRAELEILTRQGQAIAGAARDARALVEFGAGSSRKARLLLAAMPFVKIYAPVDISEEFLAAEARRLSADFAALHVVPIIADFMKQVTLPADIRAQSRLVFFPGSTIGNLEPRAALKLLRRMGDAAGADGLLLIGVDLKKSLDVLLPAYDDAQGVTAAFNLNLLRRVNRELGGNFDLAAFTHQARYDADHGRIEMHLVSAIDQSVLIAGRRIEFAEGESIHTENSYKFTVAEFHLLVRSAGFEPVETWLDDERRFSLQLIKTG